MPDGSVSQILRDRFKLKEGAVPCKFPSLSPKRKHLDDSNTVDDSIKKARMEDKTDFDNVVQVEEPTTKPLCIYLHIRKELKRISVHNKWWTVNCTPSYIICAKWDTSFAAERKIIITDDLSIKV